VLPHDPPPEFVIGKSPVFTPLLAITTLVIPVEELLVNVKVVGEEDDPVFTDPKFWLVGKSVTDPDDAGLPPLDHGC